MKKLLPLLILAMVMANACAVMSRMAPRDEQLAHGVRMAATAEGTSIDNHHAIPRPEYDSWSSPGNMPGSGHDIGE
uniref:Lipoprotein n=1 Tax=Leersia perrieri TaxID=77586 RepID=A0A0D9W2I1_9ORYZ